MEVTTEQYTTQCDEGAVSECYQTEDVDSQFWVLVGDVGCKHHCCGCCDNNEHCKTVDFGYADTYRKTCGNDEIVDYDLEIFDQ